jgi:MFS transporter, MCT family, solute carrier family 16 (monocarboxylic acid transporters), member 3
LPARPLLGFLADRYIGPLNTFTAACIVLGGVFYVWIPIKTEAAMYGFAILYGVVSAAAMGMFVGALVSLTKDLSKTGTRFGMVCSILAFASLTGPPIAGALIQSQNGSYTIACIWSGSVMLAGSAMLVLSRVCETGWVLRVKK